MTITDVVPFMEAIDYLRGKSLLPTFLSEAQLNAMDRQVKEQSFWSAKVTDAGFLQEALSLIDKVVAPGEAGGPGSGITPPRFREMMREYLAGIGYSPEPGTEGSIKDLTTTRRLDLIVDTNTQIAQGFGQAVQRNDPVALEAFPADELVRISNFGAVSRGTARDWPGIWRGGGGRFFGGGRMIARRDDPVWVNISHFGNPYPPFHYNSGMWTRPIARAEAVQLGVISRDEQAKPVSVSLSGSLQAGLQALAPALQTALQAAIPGAVIKDGVLTLGGG